MIMRRCVLFTLTISDVSLTNQSEFILESSNEAKQYLLSITVLLIMVYNAHGINKVLTLQTAESVL